MNSPRWIGITGIQKVFTDTNAALDTIAQNSNSAFSDTNWTTTDPPQFETALQNTNTKFATRTLVNPNPATSKKAAGTITPIYIKNYGDYKKSNTFLNIIYQEFNLRITASISFVNQAKEYSKTIGQYSSDIKSTITGINSNLQPLTSTFTDLETTVIKNWIDYVNI